MSGNGCTIWNVRARPRRLVRLLARDVHPLEQHRPGGGRQHARHQVDKRRLAGSVRADQADDLAASER
jgi:hypothetical protein